MDDFHGDVGGGGTDRGRGGKSDGCLLGRDGSGGTGGGSPWVAFLRKGREAAVQARIHPLPSPRLSRNPPRPLSEVPIGQRGKGQGAN